MCVIPPSQQINLSKIFKVIATNSFFQNSRSKLLLGGIRRYPQLWNCGINPFSLRVFEAILSPATR